MSTDTSSRTTTPFLQLVLLVIPLYYLVISQQKQQFATVDPSAATLRSGKDLVLQNPNQIQIEEEGSGAKCVTFDQELDKLIASSGQVFVASPAKAGGSSMKSFIWKCFKVSSSKIDRTINSTSVSNSMSFLVDDGDVRHVSAGLVPPGKVIGFHLMSDEPFEVLLDNIPSDALVIYLHREETDRLLSAIKQVLFVSCLNNKHPDIIQPQVNGTACQVRERDVVENVIQPKAYEIGWGGPEIMTCKFYQAIERNFPRMVFMNYKQIDRLHGALAAHHCPDVKLPAYKNTGAEKEMEMFIELEKTGELIPLQEWLNEKRNMLEWTLQLKGGNKCQAKTRTMQNELYSCKDELLQVTRHTSF